MRRAPFQRRLALPADAADEQPALWPGAPSWCLPARACALSAAARLRWGSPPQPLALLILFRFAVVIPAAWDPSSCSGSRRLERPCNWQPSPRHWPAFCPPTRPGETVSVQPRPRGRRIRLSFARLCLPIRPACHRCTIGAGRRNSPLVLLPPPCPCSEPSCVSLPCNLPHPQQRCLSARIPQHGLAHTRPLSPHPIVVLR